jgi:hypothetical protein
VLGASFFAFAIRRVLQSLCGRGIFGEFTRQ